MPSTYTNLLYHIIFSTKERRPFLQGELLTDMHAYLGSAVRGEKGKPLEIGGIADHVHMLPRALSLGLMRSVAPPGLAQSFAALTGGLRRPVTFRRRSAAMRGIG